MGDVQAGAALDHTPPLRREGEGGGLFVVVVESGSERVASLRGGPPRLASGSIPGVRRRAGVRLPPVDGTGRILVPAERGRLVFRRVFRRAAECAGDVQAGGAAGALAGCLSSYQRRTDSQLTLELGLWLGIIVLVVLHGGS